MKKIKLITLVFIIILSVLYFIPLKAQPKPYASGFESIHIRYHDSEVRDSNCFYVNIKNRQHKKIIAYKLISFYKDHWPDELQKNLINKFIDIKGITNGNDVCLSIPLYDWEGTRLLNFIWGVSIKYSDTTIVYKFNGTQINNDDYNHYFWSDYEKNTYNIEYERYERGQKNENIAVMVIVIFAIVLVLWGYWYFKFNVKKIEEEEQVERLKKYKSYYKDTKIPLIIGKSVLGCTQNQTRQIATGVLIYSQPKEYYLQIGFVNISDKIISAIEIEIQTSNAFNEITHSFTISKKTHLTFGITVQYRWELDTPFDNENSVSIIKRVMFSDGTTWVHS